MVSKKNALKQLEELKKDVKPMRLAAEKWPTEFQTLISIILSARTKDETTIKVCELLFKKYGTVEKLSKAKIKDVEKIIRKVNFYKNKSRNIINCSKIIFEKYNKKVPKKINELISLPGVGRKTANVFLAEYGGNNIGVDTHVSYISQKFGWTKNSKPEKIEKDLEKLFPTRKWKKINEILVRFGKSYTSKKEKDFLLNKIKNKF